MRTAQDMIIVRIFALLRVLRAALASAGFLALTLVPDAMLATVAQGAIVAGNELGGTLSSPQFKLAQNTTKSQETAAEPTATANPFGVMGYIQDWLARANREYQSIVVKQLSLPSSDESPEDAIAKTRDTEAAAAAKKAADARTAERMKAAAEKKADEARKAGNAKKEQPKKAPDVTKADTTANLSEDKKQAEKTKRLADEAKKKADEIAKAISDAQPKPDPKAEAAANAAAETARAESRQAKQEADRLAEESRRQLAAARADEEQRKARDAARRAKIAEAKEAERAAAERDQATRREAEDKPRHTRRVVVIRPEPISRPDYDDGDVRRRSRYASERATRPRTAGYQRRASHRNGSCHGAGRSIRPPGRYVVARGDSLWRISARLYNNGRRWHRIYRANRGTIRDPDRIYPCQRVYIPKRRWR